MAQTVPQFSGFDVANQVKLDTRFYYWNENGQGNSGGQIITPFSLLSSISNETFLIELGGRAAFIHSFNNSSGASGSVSTVSDTVLNATLTLSTPQLPFYPFVTGSVNLPTGKETLSGKEKNAVMDLDLVEQTRFGEGLNFNFGGGVTIPFTDAVSATLAGSYNVRGDYTPDGDTGFEYDPGDQLTVYGEFVHTLPDSYASVGLKYNREDDSTLNGVEYFQPGDYVELYGTIAGAISPKDTLTATVSFAQYSKNEIFDPFTGVFGAEDSKGAGNVIRFGLGWQHKADWGHYGVSGQLLIREANDYDRLNDRFIPARKRFLVGPEVGVTLSEKATLNMRLQYMHLNEDEFPVTGLKRSFNGVQASAGVNVDF